MINEILQWLTMGMLLYMLGRLGLTMKSMAENIQSIINILEKND